MSVTANSTAVFNRDGATPPPRLFGNGRHWAAYAAFWVFLTIVTSAGGLLFEDSAPSLVYAQTLVANHAGFWMIWSVLTVFAYAASASVIPARPGTWRTAVVEYVVLALTASAVLALYYVVAGIGAPSAGHISPPHPTQAGFDHDALWFFTINVALFGFVSIATAAVRQNRNAQLKEAEQRARELENQRLAAAVSQARLTALRGQIHPHFIFNALNSIASLVETQKSELAYDAVTALADILRATFQSMEQDTVRLEEEFALVRHMFELGSLRFGDRFSWQLNLPDELKDARIQPFLIQPLAENVLLHAVGKSSGPVRAQVSATRENGRLVLEVGDDGPGAGPAAMAGAKGVGLQNLRERLSLIGGTLDLSTSGAGLAAVVVLPAPEGTARDER